MVERINCPENAILRSAEGFLFCASQCQPRAANRAWTQFKNPTVRPENSGWLKEQPYKITYVDGHFLVHLYDFPRFQLVGPSYTRPHGQTSAIFIPEVLGIVGKMDARGWNVGNRQEREGLRHRKTLVWGETSTGKLGIIEIFLGDYNDSELENPTWDDVPIARLRPIEHIPVSVKKMGELKYQYPVS